MGARLLYYLIIIPLSKMPFWLLYLKSDFLYLILYRLVGYRTKVVRSNLRNSFPEKGLDEIKKIESTFYRHLCDLVVESIKAFSISLPEARQKVVDRNIEEVDKHRKSGKDVMVIGGHYGNWELFAITIGQASAYEAIALYTPLKNKFMDRKIKASRTKYGLQLLPVNQVKKRLSEKKSKGGPYMVIFGSDPP